MRQNKLVAVGCGIGALASIGLLLWSLTIPAGSNEHLGVVLELLRATEKTATIQQVGSLSLDDYRASRPGAPEQGRLLDLLRLAGTDEAITGRVDSSGVEIGFEATYVDDASLCGAADKGRRVACLLVEVANLDTLRFIYVDRQWLYSTGSDLFDSSRVQELLAEAPIYVPRRALWLGVLATACFSLACLLIVVHAPASPPIFLSYRRADNPDGANRLYRTLRRRFGPGSVFLDTEDVPAAIDFRKFVNQLMHRAKVALVLIGDRWEETRADGSLRLMEEEDLVRIEIETALSIGLEVLPVLMAGASMPGPQALPESVREMTYRNASELDSGKDFDVHVKRLMSEIEEFVPSLVWIRYGIRTLFLIAAVASAAAVMDAGVLAYVSS